MNKIDWDKPLETVCNMPAVLVCRLNDCVVNDLRNVVRYENSCGLKEFTTLVDDYGRSRGGYEFIRNKAEPKRYKNIYQDKNTGALFFGSGFFNCTEAATQSAQDYLRFYPENRHVTVVEDTL